MITRLSVLLTFTVLTACKPPPTDADMLREVENFASAPLPSPDTTGAVWALSEANENRILYGIPREPALLMLECLTGSAPTLQITRISPADEGAGAMLALVGNGHIGRVRVDATLVSGRYFWVGEELAVSDVWEPLAGVRELIATVPGGGTVEMHPSTLPGALIEDCRAGVPFDPGVLGDVEEDEELAAEPEANALPLP